MTVTLLSTDPDPVTLRFDVLIDWRWREDWTLDRIKRAISEGARLETRS